MVRCPFIGLCPEIEKAYPHTRVAGACHALSACGLCPFLHLLSEKVFTAMASNYSGIPSGGERK